MSQMMLNNSIDAHTHVMVLKEPPQTCGDGEKFEQQDEAKADCHCLFYSRLKIFFFLYFNSHTALMDDEREIDCCCGDSMQQLLLFT